MPLMMRKTLYLLLCLSLAMVPLRAVLAMPATAELESHCASAGDTPVAETAETERDCCNNCEQGCADGHCNHCLQAGAALLLSTTFRGEPPAAHPEAGPPGLKPDGIYTPPFRPPATL